MGGHKTARIDSIVPGIFGRFRSKSRTRLIYSGVSSNTNRSENHRILSSAAGSRGQSEGTADICTAKPRPAQRARFAYRSPTTDHTPGLPQVTIHKINAVSTASGYLYGTCGLPDPLDDNEMHRVCQKCVTL